MLVNLSTSLDKMLVIGKTYLIHVFHFQKISIDISLLEYP